MRAILHESHVPRRWRPAETYVAVGERTGHFRFASRGAQQAATDVPDGLSATEKAVTLIVVSAALLAIGISASATAGTYPEAMTSAKEILLDLFVSLAGAMPAYRITRPNPHLWPW